MEAATLKKNKRGINKGKIKKTIKNILCRPDNFWPLLSEENCTNLIEGLNKYKICIPEFKKPHWKELKLIPKSQRPKPPKPPKILRIEGLLFGISECSDAIKNGICAAVIIESSVNPRIIVQPVLDACLTNKIPVVCLSNLKNTCHSNFGIKTSCLGIKQNYLPELTKKVTEMAKLYEIPDKIIGIDIKNDDDNSKDAVHKTNEIEVEKKKVSKTDLCPYLFRVNKNNRVFTPPSEYHENSKNVFAGQNFIEFTKKTENIKHCKEHVKMILKRISNNPNRKNK